ncbi:Protein RarD [Alphaproteobacteria bacterium SO-S41]|nr:Protein RarD [Alphaproteobacteria bacterium SO-S41]
MPQPKDSLNGVIAAATSYVIWGVVVVYWKLIHDVSAWEVLTHRMLWCLAFLAPIVLALGRGPAIWAALSSRRSVLALLTSAILIAGNWGIFIWAVQEGRIVETSLGYYINPLLAILIGVVMLGEQLSRWRMAAFALAAAGVAVQAVALGGLPWISIVLATSFATYGYVRKVVKVEALDGLFVETLLVAPFAGIYVWLLAEHGELAFGHVDWVQTLLLVGAGPVTAIPLWLFSVGARKVRMSTLGFLQYIAPTISLAIAVFIYHEPFGLVRAISFALIWSALVVVSFDALRRPAIVTPEER